METSDSLFKWAQLVLTTVFGGLLAAGGTFYLKQMDTRIENEKIAQIEREFHVRQKETEVELTAKMFGLLMERYLKQDALPARLLTLRLLALNFADVPMNLRPIFQDLEKHLSGAKEKQQLRQIAREVARRQAFRLAAESGGRQELEGVQQGSEVPIQNTPFLLRVISVDDDGVEVELIEGERRIGPFTTTYYDWPLVDNTKFGEQRLALMLLAGSGGKANLRVIHFPSSLAPDRIDLKELGRYRGSRKH